MSAWFKRLFARTNKKGQLADADGLACQEVVELVTAYLEGVLLPEERAHVDEHLDGCDGCTNYVKQVRMTLDMLRNLAKEPAFPETRSELLQVFQQWKKNA